MSRTENKPPAYQWFPKDYDTDEAVKLMTYEQEGIYRRLLDHQALHGSIPADPREIAMLVPKVSPARFMALWPRIVGKFVEVDGRRVNPKLERVKADFAEFIGGRSRGGRASAESRRRLFGTAQPNATPNTAPNNMPNNSPNNTPNIARTSPRTDAEPASASASAKEQERARVEPMSAQLVERFRALWRSTYGHECSLILSPLEFMKLEQQVESLDGWKLLEALAAYFKTPDEYVRKARHPMALFLRDPFKYLATKAAEPVEVPRGCKHQPPCVDAAAHTARDMAERRQAS